MFSDPRCGTWLISNLFPDLFFSFQHQFLFEKANQPYVTSRRPVTTRSPVTSKSPLTSKNPVTKESIIGHLSMPRSLLKI